MNSDVLDVTDGGERVTHLYPNSCYYAHLSIYQFAIPYSQGRTVLDAGAGAGYGAHFLATHGAKQVTGVDASAKAVAFSREHFQHPNLTYQVMNLEELRGFDGDSFDLVFSSNTLEHLRSVPDFLRQVCDLLRGSGALIVAVPPILNEELRQANIDNPYHLNIWSPQQWQSVLRTYFESVRCFRHHFEAPGVELDFSDTPETTRVRETDFSFLPTTVEEMYRFGCITAIFVAERPRAETALPQPGAPLEFVDSSFSRPFSRPVPPPPPRTSWRTWSLRAFIRRVLPG